MEILGIVMGILLGGNRKHDENIVLRKQAKQNHQIQKRYNILLIVHIFEHTNEKLLTLYLSNVLTWFNNYHMGFNVAILPSNIPLKYIKDVTLGHRPDQEQQDGMCQVFLTNNIITKIHIKFYIKFKMGNFDMFYVCLAQGWCMGINP